MVVLRSTCRRAQVPTRIVATVLALGFAWNEYPIAAVVVWCSYKIVMYSYTILYRVRQQHAQQPHAP